VLENYGPGTMEKLGCDWKTLCEKNSRLIYLALKGYLGGPWQDRPALAEVVQFHSGLAYMTGPPGQPVRAGASVIDILGAVFGVTGVLAALRERDQTGVGQRVGSSLFESAVFLMGSHMAGSATTGEPLPPMTARRGAWGIYDVFASSNGEQLFVGVTSDAQWLRFCEVFEFHDYAQDERLITNNDRVRCRSWLITDLAERFAGIEYDKLIQKCATADISWAPVGRPEHLFDNEHLLASAGLLHTMLASAEGSASSSTLLPALPLEFGSDQTRPGLAMQPPECGEHTDEILLGSGYSNDDVAKLRNLQAVV